MPEPQVKITYRDLAGKAHEWLYDATDLPRARLVCRLLANRHPGCRVSLTPYPHPFEIGFTNVFAHSIHLKRIAHGEPEPCTLKLFQHQTDLLESLKETAS